MIRDLEIKDLARLDELHKSSGFDYKFPFKDKDGEYAIPPLFIVNQVIGSPVKIAISARLTTEIFGFFDKDWATPGIRFDMLKKLQESVRVKLRDQGIEDGHLWLPPQVKNFERRLMNKLGWDKALWNYYVRET